MLYELCNMQDKYYYILEHLSEQPEKQIDDRETNRGDIYEDQNPS